MVFNRENQLLQAVLGNKQEAKHIHRNTTIISVGT